MNDATRFMLSVQRPLRPGEYAEVRAIDPNGGPIHRRWCLSPAQVTAYADYYSTNGYNVYFGINPRRGKTSGDANVTRSIALPADIDAKLWCGDLDVAAGALACEMGSFPFRPSVIVASGGGWQCYWLLTEEMTDWRRWRTLANRMARALCGRTRTPDLVANPERVLRLPGTLNRKYDPARVVRLLECSPDRRYRASDLETWLDEFRAWTAPAPIPEPVYLSRTPLNDVIDDFNARYDLGALLVRHGAVELRPNSRERCFAKPGQRTLSATVDYRPGLLILHATQFLGFHKDQGRGYDAFEVFKRLEHGGNFGAARASAIALGYGQRFGMAIDMEPARDAVRRLAGRYA